MKYQNNPHRKQAGKKKPNRFNKTLPASQIFKGLLPQGYRQKWAQIEQFQQFFLAQESDAVFKMVQVHNVTSDTLFLSVPSPALANYLRLHSEQIKIQIKESFGQSLELKISSRPEPNTASASSSQLSAPNHFSEKVCEQVADAADSVEDKALQSALKSLSKVIAK